MADTGRSLGSLRLDRREISRLVIVIVLSLAMHLIGVGGYEISKQFHPISWLHWLARTRSLPQQPPATDPVIFAMVPAPSKEAPKNAKYYGAQNSVAADDTHGDQDQAQINGKQPDVPDVATGPKIDPNKLQPASPQEEEHPVVDPGDLMVGKVSPPQPQTRPQKLSQVQPRTTPGVRMSQSGGAPRPSLVPSFDVKASAFGLYDQKFIEAVSQRWYDLLDSRKFALDRSGKVVVRFHLNYDGTVSDMTVVENSVGALLGQVCQDAVHDPAPFAVWPDEMRHQIGQTYREITFTFYYY